MRRRLLRLAVIAGLTVGSAVATAGTAAAKPGGVPADPAMGAASAKSVLFYCPNTADHPGKHTGWANQPSGERRIVGGTCPAG